ncbi:MAG: hypothetical protein PWP54_1446 [Thermosipho sp. (in: thermotogales)]|nr:hypothetical protein [Thermosipho sp. (in: thermotogales)]
MLEILNEFKKLERPHRVDKLKSFFRASPNGYGYENDKFFGLTVPETRKIAKKFKNISLKDVESLLKSDYHEVRLCALFILREKYKKCPDEVIKVYLNNLEYVNNWDLVDSSAPYLLGQYLYDKDRTLLYDLAKSGDLWKQRIAILSTFYFIKQNDFEDTLRISEILLNHKHDLIHKAVGWMLREIGKRNKEIKDSFLKKYYKFMPRTMLRYAIEKYPEEERQKFLKGEI